MNYLLDHCPPQLHLVIITRADSPLFLARRRGRSEVVEVRSTDLCFTIEETVEFFGTCMGLNLSIEDVATLENRTAGWIVGLQMAALKPPFTTCSSASETWVYHSYWSSVLRTLNERDIMAKTSHSGAEVSFWI